MEGIKVLRSTQIIILGICFVVATITSTVILSKGLLTMKKYSEQVVKVTGSAEKNIVSDAMVWKLSFSRRDVKMVVAFDLLKEDLKTVKDSLGSPGAAARAAKDGRQADQHGRHRVGEPGGRDGGGGERPAGAGRRARGHCGGRQGHDLL